MTVFLSPKPKQCELSDGDYILKTSSTGTTALLSLSLPKVFSQECRKIFGKKGVKLDVSIGEGTVKAPKNPAQAYKLNVTAKGIVIEANTELGALYALQTLKQLKTGSSRFQCCSILDYPDVEWRICARPNLCGECLRSSLDWGDGRRGFVKRWKSEIDYALACKYNGAFIYGFTLDTDCWKGFAADMRKINRYALERGVRLIYGFYGMSYGGWGGETYLGAAHAFVPGAGHEIEQDFICGINNPNKPETGKNGTCRSFEALWQQKVKDVRRFIKVIEPGALYIHSEDISDYHGEWELFWRLRCPNCRKRWPNENADAADGGAGAIAHGYDAFCEARKGVKNDHYDAERDCALLLTSPCYGGVSDDDETWGHLQTLWTNVAKEMKYKDNIFYCLREQFVGENGKLRIKALADEYKKRHCHQKIMLFSVGGAALYGENASFSSMPEMNSFFDGASAIFNFSGVIYQRPQQLYNSECTWNLEHRKDGETLDVSSFDRKQSLDLLVSKVKKELAVEARHQQPDGWLAKACAWIYGEAAGEKVWKYLLLNTSFNAYPLSIVFKHGMMDRVIDQVKGPYPEETKRVGLRLKCTLPDQIKYWQELADVTAQGQALIKEAEALTAHGFLKDELAMQVKTLGFGQLFCLMMHDLFLHVQNAPASPKKKLQASLIELRKCAETFPKDFLTVNDGEASLYLTYCDKIETLIKELD